MHKPSRVLGVLVAVAAVGCGGSSKPKPTTPAPAPAPTPAPAPVATEPPPPALPPIPTTAAPAPAELIATASSPAPASVIPLLADYVDHVQPGAGAQVTVANLVEAAARDGLDLHGVDLGKPVRFLVLDPSRFHQPFIAVVGVADEKVLAAQVAGHGARYETRNGFAAIGDFTALSEAGGYALTTLLDAPLAPQPTLDLDVKYLMLHYGTMLDQIAEAASAAQPADEQEMMKNIIGLYLSLFRQIDHARFSAEIDGNTATAMVHLQPLAGSGLAGFIGKQQPSTFEVLEKLPAGAMGFGGRMDLRDTLEPFLAAAQPMMTKVYGEEMGKLMSMSQRWIALVTGENGITAEVSPGKIELAGLFDVDDPKPLRALWSDMLAALTKAKVAGIKIATRPMTYGGTKLTTIDITLGKDATPEQKTAFEQFGGKLSYVFGVGDKASVFALGGKAGDQVKAMVDLAAGKKAKTPPDAGRAAAIADLRAHKESYAMTMDLVQMMSAFAPGMPTGARPATPPMPVIFALGVDGGDLGFRVALPASQLAPFVAMAMVRKSGGSAEVDTTLTTMDGLADQVCACKDQACADAVMKQVAAVEEPMAKPDDEQSTRAMTIARRMNDCYTKLQAH
ncbi:MAG TPA: hypothetical protein VHE35_04025 [Kofleriaceae bacterium]|nr:hypothetical protein [Kofleriaceae bacterium]